MCGWRCCRNRGGPDSPGIDAVLDDALIVPSRKVAPDIVTMYSQVLLRMVEDGTLRKLTLCYPQDAEPSSASCRSSRRSASGCLVSRSARRWAGSRPDGTERMAELDAILFQPEASGDYTT